jgi:glycosyltransferase involved in cell wall biosynthesis
LELNISINFSIIQFRGKYFAPVSEGCLIEEIAKKCDSVKLNTFIVNGIGNGKLIDIPNNLSINRLNQDLCHYYIGRKIINYLRAICKCYKNFNRNGFWYLFIPGNISLICGIIGFIYKRKYAVYVRGDWKRKKFLLKYLYNLIIRGAKFALVEGAAFSSEIKKSNEETYEVSPIMLFNKGDYKNKNNFKIRECAKLLFVGRIEKDKGLIEMLCAIRKVVNRNCKLILTLVGESNTKDKKEIDALIKNLNLDLYVRKTGIINNKQELSNYYKNADIFIFPSRHEGFPRVIYEAMLFSLPIICTKLPGIKEFMNDKKNCLQVNINDEKDLEDKIFLMVSNRVMRENLGRQAQIDVMSVFDKFENIDHATQLYTLFKKSAS